MRQLIILYNLKPNVSPETFEEWVRTVEQPNMRGLSRVNRLRTFRSDALLTGVGKPSVQYVELFDITDLDAFNEEDMPSDMLQMVMGGFMGLTENAELIIASEV